MKNNLCIGSERGTGENEFERHLQIAKQRSLGIEIQEFSLPEVMLGDWRTRLDQYKALLRDFQEDLSIHNAFRWIDHLGLDQEIFQITRNRYDFIFMIAGELGCEFIVSHFDWNPFVKGPRLSLWQEGQLRFWERYVNMAEKEGIVILGENTAETRPEIIKPVLDGINSQKFKFALDVGHVNLHSEVPLESWLTTFGSDLIYMHIHNNSGDYDSHSSVLKGTIDFDDLFKVFEELDMAPVLTTEIYGEGLLESLDYLEEKIRASKAYQ